VDHREVRGVVRVVEIRIESLDLSGRKHALVDERLARQAADVEVLRLLERLVAAQPVACTLANQIQLALEGVAVHSRTGRDDQLLDMRHRRARAFAEIGLPRFRGNDAPTDEPLAFLGAQLGDHALAVLALALVGGKEDVTGGE
jgi:hypothetical protein